jgi:hypothetical protein
MEPTGKIGTQVIPKVRTPFNLKLFLNEGRILYELRLDSNASDSFISGNR